VSTILYLIVTFKERDQLAIEKKWRWTIVAVILLFFIITLQLIQPKPKGNQVGDIHFANHWQEVKDFQYLKTPGLKRAEELGLVRTYDVSVAIPDTDYTLSIDQIWYNQKHAEIFYSIDLGRKARQLKFSTEQNENATIPALNFNFSKVGVEEDTWNSPYSNNWSPWEGVVYKQRFYHRLTVSPLLDEERNPLTEVDEVVLQDLTVETDEQYIHLDDLVLPLHYDRSKEHVRIIPINEKYEVLDSTVYVDRLEVGTSKNKLYFRLNHPKGHIIHNTGITIKTDIEERRGHQQGREENVFLEELYYDERGIMFTILYLQEPGLSKPYTHLVRKMPYAINPQHPDRSKKQENGIFHFSL
jgi:hypothetical protein